MSQQGRGTAPAEFLELLFDLCVLNLLFLAGMLPVVTGGASLAGLCYAAEKLRRQEGRVAANFMRGSRRNFRQATAVWLVTLPAAAFLFVDLYLLIQDGAGAVYYLLIGLIFFWLLSDLVYLFPLLVWFDNRLIRHVRNAWGLAIAHLGRTVCLIALALSPALLWLFSPRLLLYTLVFWILIGFSSCAYCGALLLRRILPLQAEDDDTAS